MNTTEKDSSRKFCIAAKVFDGCKEQENNEKYDLPDYLPDVNKLLRVGAQLCRINRFVNGDMLEYDGTVCYSVLYATSQGEIKNAAFDSPFEGSMAVSGYEDGCALDFRASAENVSCRLQGPRKLTAKSKIHVCAVIYSEKCTEPEFAGKLTTAERENMQYLCEGIESETHESFESRGNSVSEDVEIPAGMPQAAEIISVETDTYIYDMRPSENGLSYKGDVIANILYLAKAEAENEEEAENAKANEYVSLVRKIPIYGDIPADFETENPVCLGRADITKLEYRTRENVLGENRVIEIDFDYDVFADCYGNTESKVVKDIYSLDYESENDYSSLSFRNVAKAQTFNFSVNSTEQSGETDFDRVISSTAAAIIENVTKENGKLIFKGKAEASLILGNGDGVFAGRNYTVPFRAEADAGKTGDNFTYSASCTVISAQSRIADEKTAIDLEIAVSFITFNEYETLAATRSTVYKDKPVYTPAHSAVLIYYPSKDEKLWGIAKKYNTTEDALRRANGITGDFATGSMLIVPRSTH